MERTGRAVRYLRRFTWSEEGGAPLCADGSGYHDALVYLPGSTSRLRHHGDGRPYAGWPVTPPPRSDPRWPRTCSRCDYRFRPRDNWQAQRKLLMRRVDTGEEMAKRELPPGAMWDDWWSFDDWRGADGLALTVRCPNGMDWNVDAPATGGGRWERSGTPPDVTANPSIAIGDPADPRFYHGWLHAGVLTPA